MGFFLDVLHQALAYPLLPSLCHLILSGCCVDALNYVSLNYVSQLQLDVTIFKSRFYRSDQLFRFPVA